MEQERNDQKCFYMLKAVHVPPHICQICPSNVGSVEPLSVVLTQLQTHTLQPCFAFALLFLLLQLFGIGFDCGSCFGWNAKAMTCPGFLAVAVEMVLIVALALAGTHTVQSNLTAQAKKPGHLIMLCGRHTSLLKPLKGGDIQGRPAKRCPRAAK